jgi:hypothetical protein
MSFVADDERHEWRHSTLAEEGGLLVRLLDIRVKPL